MVQGKIRLRMVALLDILNARAFGGFQDCGRKIGEINAYIMIKH